MKKNKIQDALYLVQIILLFALIVFFTISLFVKELEIIYKIFLAMIFIVMGYNSRGRNSKTITYLYYFASLCVLISIIVGVVNG